jgi:hypothetical protein
MSNVSKLTCSHEEWARFRFSVIGPLLAAPPERGELQELLQSLADRKWRHPMTGQWVQFGLSTIERWFYTARISTPTTDRHTTHPSDHSVLDTICIRGSVHRWWVQ